MTFACRFGRTIWTSFSSESRSDSRTVGPYIVLTRLAWTIAYGLFIINELILMEVLAVVAVASSKRVANSIVSVFFVWKKKKKWSSIQCTSPKAAASLWHKYLKIRITSMMTFRGDVPFVGECLKPTREWRQHPPAINKGRVKMAATVWLTP